MSNHLNKLEGPSIDSMTKHDIAPPEDKSKYGEIALARIEELFGELVDDNELLVDLDLSAFPSRRDEGEFFLSLRKAGYPYDIVRYKGDLAVLIQRKSAFPIAE